MTKSTGKSSLPKGESPAITDTKGRLMASKEKLRESRELLKAARKATREAYAEVKALKEELKKEKKKAVAKTGKKSKKREEAKSALEPSA